MTLIEVIVAVLIVIIFAGLLLPTLGHPRPARIAASKFEMNGLSVAIKRYEGYYNHLPLADANTNDDITFGIGSTDIKGFQKVSGSRLVASNSDLMIILLDIDQGVNAGHKMNPQNHQFLTPKMVRDTKSGGVSTVDYQYRDPWGNPLIISLDANYDEHVRDACYASKISSLNPASLSLTNRKGFFELDDSVMIWSLGPDGQASMDNPASVGVNKDNVLGWQ